MKHFIRALIVGFVFLFAPVGNAAEQPKIIPAYDMAAYDQKISQLYQTVSETKSPVVAERIAAISQYFLGEPYVLGALGEGPDADYDQAPVYRTDAFDCVTFASTVLALAESNNLDQFKRTIREINYRDGKVIFSHRNHFMEIDWNPNNQRKGFLQDITNTITDQYGKPIAKKIVTMIDKSNWFRHYPLSRLHFLHELSISDQEKRINALHSEAQQFQPQLATTFYLPLTALFNSDGQPNMALFAQIPTGSVIEIVRPHLTPTNDTSGTKNNISHLGLAIRTPDGLMFREASSEKNKVVDILLTDYLKHYINSPTVIGINVQKITFSN